MQIINRLSIKEQLLLFFSVGIFVLLAITSYGQYVTAISTLTDKQIEQGLKVSQSVADQSTLALLYDSPDNAQAIVDSTLEFPDVVAFELYRGDGSRLLSSGDVQYRSTPASVAKDAPLGLQFENNDAWYFVAPVNYYDASALSEIETDKKVESIVLGHVRLTISKASLNKTAKEHLWTNVLWTVVLGVIFIPLLIYITNRLTNPIKDLVEIMGKAQGGARGLEAKLNGPKDIQLLAEGYNLVLQAREHEEIKVKVDAELALATADMQAEFTAKVSHELRTPMNGIMGTIELIEDEGGLSPKQRELVDVMQHSANSLLEFINDILDYSKADAGKLKIEREDFYIADVCQDIINLMGGDARRKDISLVFEMDLDLPDLVHGDKGKVRQILTNLIGNAIKFTDSGKITVKVVLVEQLDSIASYKITVEDTGIGMSQDVLETVFDPFTQIDGSSSGLHGGTGLGLTICKQLVDLLGGHIEISSDIGIGSTFSFTLSFELAHENIAVNLDKYRPEVAGLRILVVDESTVSSLAISKILKRWNAYQQLAEDANAAMRKLRNAATQQKHFDYLIMDSSMDHRVYVEFIRKIITDKELCKTRIIMVFDSKTLGKSEAYEAGVSGIVERPIRDTKLYQCITSIMNSNEKANFADASQDDLLSIERKILIVEDNATNQIVAQEILSRLGCKVDTANHGQDAIDNYFHRDYDLIFMDCRMPGVDGYDATRYLRKMEGLDKRTPVIAMTANNEDESNKAQCYGCGMDDFLPKPLSIKSVRGALAKWANEISSTRSIQLPSKVPAPGQDVNVERKHVDRAGFQELIDNIGSDSVERMVTSFVGDLGGTLHELTSALRQEDRLKMIEIAHSLKGSSMNFAAGLFADQAKKIEISAQEEGFDVIEPIIEKLTLYGLELKNELAAISIDSPKALVDESTYRILIAEDNESERIALTGCLKGANIFIDEVSTGTAAVEYCSRNLPDLILLDALMPEPENPTMNGFEACRLIKQLPGSVPVLMVTGLNDQESINVAMEAGASDFISKPLNFKALQKRVQTLLISSQSERQLEKVSFTDSVTGLPNRAHFVDHLSKLLEEPTADSVLTAVVFISLKQIEFIKKSRGSEFGEMVVQYFAKRLKLQVTENVFVAKAAGDEFTVVLRNFQEFEEIEVFVQTMLDELGSPYYIQAESIEVTATLGISVYPTDGDSVSTILKAADTASFCARENHTGYLFYDDGMNKQVRERNTIVSGLGRAIEENELVLYYQPLYSTSNEKVDSCEALVRWDSPIGMLPPDRFIPYAEESGSIIQLGKWVLENVCKQMVVWSSEGYAPINCAINLSAKQLEDPSLLDMVTEVLNSTGVSAKRIVIEITESTLVSNPEQCLSTLEELKNIGFRVALDDFGTGYSSFTHLVRYPIDTMKIDRGFISELGIDDTESKKIVQSLVKLSHSMGFSVVAEGVETHAQQRILVEMGCDYLQGYLIGRAKNAEAFGGTVLQQVAENGEVVTPITKAKQNRRTTR